MNEQVGVFRHYRDERFYQALFVADLVDDVLAADVDLAVFVEAQPDGYVAPDGVRVGLSPRCEVGGVLSFLVLFVARSHGAMAKGTRVYCYLPLYADKPGRRISVRPVSEWTEQVVAVCVTCRGSGKGFDLLVNCHYCKGSGDAPELVQRFQYVGDTVPGT